MCFEQSVEQIELLQCVAVCCSALQCVTVCCSVWMRSARVSSNLSDRLNCCSMLQYVAVCCSVMQCDAVCWMRSARIHQYCSAL